MAIVRDAYGLHTVCWLTNTMRITDHTDGTSRGELDGYVVFNPDTQRLTCLGPHASALRALMQDMRAQPISQGMSVRAFFDTLPYRLRNYTVANPVLYERSSDQEVTTA